MAKVQIDEELFYDLLRFFCMDQADLFPSCRAGIEKKLDAMVAHELYTQYKTLENPEEKEKARQKYLDMKGIKADFRW